MHHMWRWLLFSFVWCALASNTGYGFQVPYARSTDKISDILVSNPTHRHLASLGQAQNIAPTTGLPVVFVHGWCGDPTPWPPVRDAIVTQLRGTNLAVLYPNPALYFAFFDPGIGVMFQDVNGSPTQVPNNARFFAVAFDDFPKTNWTTFDHKRVADIKIVNKAHELAHIIWAIKTITGAPRVLLVTHSMGGLVARAYVESLALDYTGSSEAYDNDIDLILTLDAPHAGTLAAHLSTGSFGDCIAASTVNKSEMIPGSSTLNNLNDSTRIGAVGNTLTTVHSIDNFVLGDNDDGVVGRASQDITTTTGFVSDVYENDDNSFLVETVEVQSACRDVIPILHLLGCLATQPTTLELVTLELLPRMSVFEMLSLNPTSIALTPGQGVSFFSGGPRSNIPVIWSILEGDGGGSIDSNGNYIAPPIPGTYHVVAVDTQDRSQYGIATVTVAFQSIPAPTVSKVLPASPIAKSVDQTLTILGNNFTYPLTVTMCLEGTCFRPLSGSQILPGGTDSRVQVLVTLGQPGNWTAQVNTGAGSSAPLPFVVQAPQPDVGPMITTDDLPAASAGLLYLDQLKSSGGTTPIHWHGDPDPVIGNISLNDNGVLFGSAPIPGDFPFTATATDANGLSDERSFTLHVSAAATSDFQIHPEGDETLTINSGSSTGILIDTITASGPPQTLTFSLNASLPTGLQAQISPSTVTSGSQTNLVVHVDATVPVGNYPITISATSGVTTHSATVVVVVTAASPAISSFSFSPTVVTGGNGSTATIVLAVPAPSGGALVTLSPSGNSGPIENIPASATIPAGGTSTSFSVGTTTVTSTSSGTVTASYNGSTQTGFLTALPAPNPTNFNFSLTVTPHFQTISPGTQAQYTVNTSVISGQAQMVTFDVLNLSSNLFQATFNPPSVLAGQSSTLTISSSANTPLGAYNPNIGATSTGGQVSRQLAILFIEPAKINFLDFNPNPVIGGNITTATVSLFGTAPPGGALIELGTDNPMLASVPSAVIIPAGQSSVSFSISTTAVGDRQLALPFATYLGQKAGANSLAIDPGPEDFSFKVTPINQSIQLGDTASYVINTANTLGLRHRIGLAANLLTNNCIGISFIPTSVLSGDSAIMQMTTGACTQLGSAQIKFMALDNQNTHIQNLTLGIVPPIPIIGLSSLNLSFKNQVMGSTSPQSSIQVKNFGFAPLNIDHVLASGDFSQSNNCSNVLGPQAICIINATFTPTSTGNRTGTIQIGDNAQDNPQTITLTGDGTDFSIVDSAPATQTVSAGRPAVYNLALSSNGFSGTINLSCAVAPQPFPCNTTPTQLQLDPSNSAPAPFTVTVNTTTSSLAKTAMPRFDNRLPATTIAALVLILFGFIAFSASRSWRLATIGMLLLVALSVLTVSCGGGTSNGNNQGGGSGASGSRGAFTITVKATDGSATRTFTLMLNVN